MATLDAELVDEDITYAGMQIPFPSQVIRYLDRRTPAVLLTHLWRRNQPLRQPISGWLCELSSDPRLRVRIRAAQATGLLAAADFSHTFPALILPGAMASPSRRKPVDPTHDEESDEFDADDTTWERRGFAAMALDQAALDDRLRPMVVEVLRRWRRSPDYALRWTAARTLGLEIGLASLSKSLDELRVIGTPWELLEWATYQLTNTHRYGTCGGSQDSASRGSSLPGAATMCSSSWRCGSAMNARASESLLSRPL